MSCKRFLFLTSMILILIMSACKPKTDMPNPASVYCEENGGTLEIRTDESGGQVGICVFPDGSQCDEWAFYRGECLPGESLANMPNPASVYCEENGGTLEIHTDESGGQVGMCVFPDGNQCEEWALYRGECLIRDSLKHDVGLANPASNFCEEQGGSLEIRSDAEGGQVGHCLFTDGSECEEWTYFQGNCEVGDILTVKEIAEDGWKIYRNTNLGYRFHFPAEARISMAFDITQSVAIIGPSIKDEDWPVIFFNHPVDMPEYRPPEDVDLEQWLSDNNLLVEERLPDTEVAGLPTIHLRQPRGQQSYASDTFFFAYNGQLYSVVFLHTSDIEDWDLYNHFLESIAFQD